MCPAILNCFRIRISVLLFFPYTGTDGQSSTHVLYPGPKIKEYKRCWQSRLETKSKTRPSKAAKKQVLLAGTERRPSSSLRGGDLCRARKETLSADPNRMPSAPNLRGFPMSNLGGRSLFLARDEALCVEPERRPSLPSSRGGPLCRAREQALCSSLRGGSLCRAREEGPSAAPGRRPFVTSLRRGSLCRVCEEALCEKPERRPFLLTPRGGSLCRG